MSHPKACNWTSPQRPVGLRAVSSREDVDLFDRLWELMVCIAEVRNAALHTGRKLRITTASEYFRKASEDILQLFAHAVTLAAEAEAQDDPAEREAGATIASMLEAISISLLGNRFLDRERARAVFFMNYRDLLREHEGKCALLAPVGLEETWEVAGVSASPRELVQKARSMGLTVDRVFIMPIARGAEQIPVLQLEGAESGLESS